MIDASSQTNDVVTVTTHDSATAARITLVPVKVGIHSTYRALTKLIPDREVWYIYLIEKSYYLILKCQPSFQN